MFTDILYLAMRRLIGKKDTESGKNLFGRRKSGPAAKHYVSNRARWQMSAGFFYRASGFSHQRPDLPLLAVELLGEQLNLDTQ